jgi:hypothetical protein
MPASRPKKQVELSRLDEELFLQPWFVSRSVYQKMRRLLPSSQLKKLSYYFEDYGCIRCEKKTALYGHNGFCHQCAVVVASRIIAGLRRRFVAKGTLVDKKIIRQYIDYRCLPR